MKNKGFKLLALLCAVLLLGGCQLAREDGGEIQPDRLIGVFLTWEYLDLFDEEAFLQDNMESIAKGHPLQADGNRYQGRLYAVQLENRDFVFEGVEGMNFFAPTCTDEWGNAYTVSCVGLGISDGHTHIKSSDSGEGIALEGTVYVAPADYDRVLYQNYVYQTADGRVYATTGNGMGFGEHVGEFSFKTEESSTATDSEGNEVAHSFSLELTVKEKQPAEEIVLWQMDADHTVIAETRFAPDAAPERIVPSEACAYILVESIGEVTERQLYQPSDEGVTVYRLRPDNVLVGEYILLEWAK